MAAQVTFPSVGCGLQGDNWRHPAGREGEELDEPLATCSSVSLPAEEIETFLHYAPSPLQISQNWDLIASPYRMFAFSAHK